MSSGKESKPLLTLPQAINKFALAVIGQARGHGRLIKYEVGFR